MESIFFCLLKRREAYETRMDGAYYPYSKYRDAIAEDCQFRCVYCDSHENTIGGREAMELDHFRPWRKEFVPSKEKKFEHLKNSPQNLVHSCGVCNGFKWSHWPTEDPDRCYDHEKGWIDPFEEARANFFEVTQEGIVCAKKPPAQYQIIKLRLNRPLLQRQREFRILIDAFAATERRWQTVVDQEAGSDHAQTAAVALSLLRAIRLLLSVK